MRNLEIKLRLQNPPENLSAYFQETLYQIDTYFSCVDGRLKLREETGKTPYFIRYSRPNTETEKISVYDFYSLKDQKDLENLKKVFGSLLHEELKIVKKRDLYIFKNARIHVDTVQDLGSFMEVEVVMKTEEEEKGAQNLLEHILKMTGTKECQKVDVGYRELLLQKLDEEKVIEYYIANPKMFWVVNSDISVDGICLVRANEVVPCLFTDEKEGRYLILQLDPSIGKDGRMYTMWRKLVGKEYGINCQVLLLVGNEVITLKGEKVDPKRISRSDVHVHRSFLARFS